MEKQIETNEIIETPPGWAWQGDLLIRLDTVIALERGQRTDTTQKKLFTATAHLVNGSQREVIAESTEEGRNETLSALATEVSVAVGLARYEESVDAEGE